MVIGGRKGEQQSYLIGCWRGCNGINVAKSLRGEQVARGEERNRLMVLCCRMALRVGDRNQVGYLAPRVAPVAPFVNARPVKIPAKMRQGGNGAGRQLKVQT